MNTGVPTVAVAERIYALWDQGATLAVIAVRLDLSPEVVERTLRRRPETKQ